MLSVLTAMRDSQLHDPLAFRLSQALGACHAMTRYDLIVRLCLRERVTQGSQFLVRNIIADQLQFEARQADKMRGLALAVLKQP